MGRLGGRDSVRFAFVNGVRCGYSSDVLCMLENLEDGEETPRGAVFGEDTRLAGLSHLATMGLPLHASCQVVLACDSYNY